MADDKNILVMVAYALTHKQEVISVKLAANSTVEQAIIKSGILQRYRQIDLVKNAVGIYGKVVKYNQELQDQDRVEIYRPLVTEPMQARRKRANLQT